MIIRRQHTANFTTISNRLFDDNRLDADEMGILAYLLSRPDNWEVRRPALQRRFGIGPIAMKRIIRSWMKSGWCQATKIRLPSGRFSVLYDVVDVPGPEMTEEEAIVALSLVANEASSDESCPETDHQEQAADDDEATVGSPVAGKPVVADDRVVIYKDITNTDLTNTENQTERELARAREKQAIDLAEFKRRWPTAASDDQAKIDAAWFELSFEDAAAALNGITPFLEKLKRDKRSHVPAAWKYLREKRWTLLAEQAKAVAVSLSGYPADSPEAKALIHLHDLAGTGSGFRKIFCGKDGMVRYRKPMTAKVLRFADMPSRDQWVTAAHTQAVSYRKCLAELSALPILRPIGEGDLVPWPWPPALDGKTYTTGPPETLMTEKDYADFQAL